MVLEFKRIYKYQYKQYFINNVCNVSQFYDKDFKEYLQIQLEQQNIDLIKYYEKQDEDFDKQIELATIINLMLDKDINESQRLKLDQYLTKLYRDKYYFNSFSDINNEYQDDKYGFTVAMWLTENEKLIPKQWMHNYDIRNKDDQTLKDLMIEHDMPIPQYWENDEDMTIFDQAYFGIIPDINGHQPDEQDEQGYTVAMLLALNNIEIPKQWQHKTELQNKQGQTVAFIQSMAGKIPDKQWWHDPTIQTENGNTVAMRFAFNVLIPTKEWEHKSNMQNIEGFTVAMILAETGIIPPEQWYHKPDLQNDDGWTVAMYITYNCKQIPPKQWYHDPNIQSENYNSTVAMLLAEKGIIPPQQWYHEPTLQDDDDMTTAMYIASYCKQIPDEHWNHDPLLYSNDKQTVVTYLLVNKIVPPKQWCYDLQLRIDDQNTLQYYFSYNYVIPPRYAIYMSLNINETIQYFRNNGFPIPSKQQETNPTIFDIAMLRQIPQLDNHKPEEQNEDGWTVAMILAFQGIQPPKQWMHNYKIRNISYNTLKYYLEHKNLLIPQHWHENDITIFDQAIFGVIPDIKDHKPEEQNQDGMTIAMILAYKNITIPQCWYHDPTIQNNEDQTVAMIQANNRKIPDKQWYHNKYLRFQNILQDYHIKVPYEWEYIPINDREDNQPIIDARCHIIPELKDNDILYKNKWGQTVAIVLAYKGIVPPKQWMHDINLQDRKHNSVKSILCKSGYSYQNNQFILNCKTQLLDQMCQVCFAQCQQQFLITKCNHNVCLNCFKKLIQNDAFKYCPICQKWNWYELKYTKDDDKNDNSQS